MAHLLLIQDKKHLEFLLGLFFALFISGCSHLFYYPNQRTYMKPQQLKLLHEEIWFENSLKQKIHGWWLPSSTKESKGTFIFFHGNAENLTSHFMNLFWLPQAGYNYFIFDYPGYGQSEGKPSPKSTTLAGQAAVEWVAKHKDPRPLIIYGQSLGGIIALRTFLDTRDRIKYKAIIGDNTFSSYQRVAQIKLKQNWFTWPLQPLAYLLLSDRYAPDRDLDKISPTPLLIIQGQKDSVVEPENAEDIYKKSLEPKEIWRIEDGFHNDTFWRHNFVYRQKLIDWLDKIP
jgi:fermentation-respiration switch protein FrsA (DUF1100 family)